MTVQMCHTCEAAPAEHVGGDGDGDLLCTMCAWRRNEADFNSATAAQELLRQFVDGVLDEVSPSDVLATVQDAIVERRKDWTVKSFQEMNERARRLLRVLADDGFEWARRIVGEPASTEGVS